MVCATSGMVPTLESLKISVSRPCIRHMPVDTDRVHLLMSGSVPPWVWPTRTGENGTRQRNTPYQTTILTRKVPNALVRVSIVKGAYEHRHERWFQREANTDPTCSQSTAV